MGFGWSPGSPVTEQTPSSRVCLFVPLSYVNVIDQADVSHIKDESWGFYMV